MRIAIVTDYHFPNLGGISEHVDGQARSLTQLGHQVTVITGSPMIVRRVQDACDAPPPATFEVIRIGRSLPFYGNGAQATWTYAPQLAHKLRNLLHREQFDIVHVHAPYSPPFGPTAILNSPHDAAIVATFHSVFPRSRRMALQAQLGGSAIERIDGRICVSRACIPSLHPYFPYTYDVIPNGVDTTHYSPTIKPVEGLVGEHQNIVFVGRFDPRNGLDTMLAAYRQLFAERGASVRLIIVGDGPLRTRYERGIPARIRPYVHFAGRLNRSRPGHLAAADVFCTPCHRASFGMALLEAMSCGKATVASRIGGFELLLDHGRHGRLAHPGCHRSFADELRHLLDNHQAREHYGKTSRTNVLANYCWTHIGHRLEHYYTTLRQTGRGDPSLPTSKQMAIT